MSDNPSYEEFLNIGYRLFYLKKLCAVEGKSMNVKSLQHATEFFKFNPEIDMSDDLLYLGWDIPDGIITMKFLESGLVKYVMQSGTGRISDTVSSDDMPDDIMYELSYFQKL